MSDLKSFFLPFRKFCFSLRSNDCIKSVEASNLLASIFQINESVKSLRHREVLNLISSNLGFSKKNTSPWKVYEQYIREVYFDLDNAFTKNNYLNSDFLTTEGSASSSLYYFIRRYNYSFNNRQELFSHYLAARQYPFTRYCLENLNLFGISFSREVHINHLLSSSRNLSDYINEWAKASFLKSKMAWLYIYNSKIINCHFQREDLRNAILHNVDLRWCCFSTEIDKGDLMGADISFCDARFSDFSDCYAREAKFYQTMLDLSNFDGANLIGALFINSSLQYVSFKHVSENTLMNVSFRNSNLQYADFRGTNFINVDFRGADLRNAKGIEQLKSQNVLYNEKTIF